LRGCLVKHALQQNRCLLERQEQAGGAAVVGEEDAGGRDGVRPPRC